MSKELVEEAGATTGTTRSVATRARARRARRLGEIEERGGEEVAGFALAAGIAMKAGEGERGALFESAGLLGAGDGRELGRRPLLDLAITVSKAALSASLSAIGKDFLIARHQRQIMGLRCGNEDPINRITMNGGR